MKFIFADSLDYVDPDFDFLADRSSPERQPYWDDVYPHQLMGYAPYDGVLVSKGIVGDHRVRGKYTPGQARRFEAWGARKFLRLDTPELQHLDIFGDCGAFTYSSEDVPPYTVSEIAAFYDDAGFTHGCSVDHIIFEFNPNVSGSSGGSQSAHERFDITLENADRFLKEVRSTNSNFIPVGVVQGWSPDSMAEAARKLVAMGYDYLALGGMVPLRAPEVLSCVAAVRETIPQSTRLHLLGFAKAEQVEKFKPHNVTSFDTTSPLLRAFKDGKNNYYLPGTGSGLRYYTAIRVPQSIENPRLQKSVKTGAFRAEDLTAMEKIALDTLRAFDRGEADLDDALTATVTYGAPLLMGQPYEDCAESSPIERMRELYKKTLTDQPWKECPCPICKEISIDVMIFRGSNRNKRRGIHNLSVYRNHIQRLDLSLCHPKQG
jgi:hypothetical protein